METIKFHSHQNLIGCFNNDHNNINNIEESIAENRNYCNTEINIDISNNNNNLDLLRNSDLNKTADIISFKNIISKNENFYMNKKQLNFNEEELNAEEKLIVHKSFKNNDELETPQMKEELEMNENTQNNEFYKEKTTTFNTINNCNKSNNNKKIILCPNNSSKNLIENTYNSKNQNSPNSKVKEITDEELESLENEIKYSELYYLTLKNFTKEIYNPCKFFYTNKFQLEKLCNDLKKMLFKACDFEENIVKFSLHDLNNFDEKKIVKEIQDCCMQSNNAKLKFIFSHFRINPNFIYSDVLNQIANQNSAAEQHSNSSANANNNNNNSSNTNNNLNSNIHSGLNFNYSSGNQFSGNQSNFSSLNIMDPFIARRNLNGNAANRNISNRYYSNLLNNSNIKDKVFNLFSYLKSFKDKTELNDFTKFLIEELDYIPLKIESEGNFDFKLVKEFDWKMQLGLI